ncbi:hypothetical protein BRADI_2g43210v3 [Brachypodium distachyon]|nr:hypothetical protein BRADI_2g43210v3 [Brachypodium distachyon]
MRIGPSAFLRRAVSMSSHYKHRGSPRPHRGYSSRPSPPYPYAGAEHVSGDSHRSAVRAPPPQYGHGPQFQSPPYGYGYGQPQPQPPVQPYGAVPYNYSYPQPPLPGPQYGHWTPNLYVHELPNQHGHGIPNQYSHLHQQPYGIVPPNAGFRPGAPQPPPRLPEYRRQWRYVQKPQPRQAERFKVLSYNILADYLAQEHRDLYENVPSNFMNWNWRKRQILFEIGLWNPDILCLQEVDKFTDLEQEMATNGFSGIWKMRTGNAVDGCAIFWRTARFQLRYKEDIEFNKLGLRDNVAQLCVLEFLVQGNVQTGSIHLSTRPSHPQQAKQVVICNIHVLYNPKRGDIKLGQVRTLLDRAYTVSKMWNDAPVILCGDFNSTPKSPLYNFISEQKLNISGLTRYAISGQQTSSSQGIYSGSNKSYYKSCPPSHTTNGRGGRIIPLNGHKPPSEAKNLTRDSCLAGREPVLAENASTSCLNSESNNCFGNSRPCSGSTNLDDQGLSSCLEGSAKDACNSDAEAHAKETKGEEGLTVDNSREECFGETKIEPKEEPDSADFLYSPTTVCDEILKSNTTETVDSGHVLSSNESSGLKDFVQELRGISSNDSEVQGDLSGDVVSEDVTCGFERNNVQSDTLLNVSKDKPCEKGRGSESESVHNDCRSCESESSQSSTLFTHTLHKASNLRVEEEINTEPTHLAPPVEPMHQSTYATSDSCDNRCTPEVINKHLEEEFGKHARAFENDVSANELMCSDVNSDPTFFQEFFGDTERLHVDEDHLPTISNGLPHAQKVVTSCGSYHNDPFRWTVDEIRAATGKEECTNVEHNLKVRSVYTDVEDFERTKDANKEPLVTSYNRKFMGTVDYI